MKSIRLESKRKPRRLGQVGRTYWRYHWRNPVLNWPFSVRRWASTKPENSVVLDMDWRIWSGRRYWPGSPLWPSYLTTRSRPTLYFRSWYRSLRNLPNHPVHLTDTQILIDIVYFQRMKTYMENEHQRDVLMTQPTGAFQSSQASRLITKSKVAKPSRMPGSSCGAESHSSEAASIARLRSYAEATLRDTREPSKYLQLRSCHTWNN